MNRINLTDSELAALAAHIQRNYDYDDRSGLLVNKRTGKVVRGSKCSQRNGVCRYLQMKFQINGRHYKFLMHVVIWVWHNGCFPTKQLDHIDLDPTNNRIENLREVSGSENQMNTLYPWKPNAKTGLPGVYKHGSGYRIDVTSNQYFFRDKYEAFSHLTLMGRRFKCASCEASE